MNQTKGFRFLWGHVGSLAKSAGVELDKNVINFVQKAPLGGKLSVYLEDHGEIIDKAIERYLESDFINFTPLLYPRIEGIDWRQLGWLTFLLHSDRCFATAHTGR